MMTKHRAININCFPPMDVELEYSVKKKKNVYICSSHHVPFSLEGCIFPRIKPTIVPIIYMPEMSFSYHLVTWLEKGNNGCITYYWVI